MFEVDFKYLTPVQNIYCNKLGNTAMNIYNKMFTFNSLILHQITIGHDLSIVMLEVGKSCSLQRLRRSFILR